MNWKIWPNKSENSITTKGYSHWIICPPSFKSINDYSRTRIRWEM